MRKTPSWESGSCPIWIRDDSLDVSRAIRISGECRTNGSGDYEGTYLLPDGRVFEEYLEFGKSRYAVWPSRKDYQSYRCSTPYQIYWNG